MVKKSRVTKIARILLCLLMVVGTWQYSNVEVQAATPEGFDSGAGTSGNPWIIKTPEQLNKIRNHMGSHFKLGSDITLSGDWEPIGDNNNAFTGNFDGAGHTIYNLQINKPESADVGFFANIKFNTIRNVTIRTSSNGVKGEQSVGILVGDSSGNIENCQTYGSVSGNNDIGGLVGFNGGVGVGSITNSYSTATVNGNTYAGGLVGINFANITNSYSSGSVNCNAWVGGLVGSNYANVSNSYYNKDTSGQSDSGRGTGLSNVEMKQQAKFGGFDFNNTWGIYEGDGSPYLRVFNNHIYVKPIAPTAKVYDGQPFNTSGITWQVIEGNYDASNRPLTGKLELAYPNTINIIDAINAGQYEIVQGSLDGPYQITVASGVMATIDQANLETPVLQATHGQTLENINIPSETYQNWQWVTDTTTPVGEATTAGHIYKASYTPRDTNYKSVVNQDVKVMVEQATPTVNVTLTPDPGTYGEEVTIGIEVPKVGVGANPTGTIKVEDVTDINTPITIKDNIPLDQDGKASINTNEIQAGERDIKVTYSGDTNYKIAENTKENYNIKKAEQNGFTFETQNPDPKTYIDGFTFANKATGGNGEGAISYEIITNESTASATIDPNTGDITNVTKAGELKVVAMKAEDTNYNKATATYTLTIKKGTQRDFSINPVDDKTYGDAAFDLSTSGGDGTGAVTYEVTAGTDIVSIEAGTNIVNITNAGEATITATKAEDDLYKETTATIDIKIKKANQTDFSIHPVEDKIYGDTPFTLTTIGGIEEGTVSYKVKDSDQDKGILEVSETGEVSILKPGTVIVEATKTGNGNYNPVTVETTITVKQATPTIEVEVKPDSIVYGDSVTLGITVNKVGNGKIPMGTVTIKDGEAVLIENLVLNIAGKTAFKIDNVTVGTHPLTITYNGNTNYTEAVETKEYQVGTKEDTNFSFEKEEVIKEYAPDFSFINPIIEGEGTGAITYQIVAGSEGIATINPDTGEVTNITKVGALVIEATKASDGNYTERSIRYTLLIDKAMQSGYQIVNPGTKVYGDDDFIIETSEGIADATTITVEDNGVLDYDETTNTASILKPGTVKVTAVNSGNEFYKEAKDEITITIEQATPTAVVTIEPEEVVYEEAVTVNVGVQPRGIGSIPTGDIEVLVDGKIVEQNITLSEEGKASVKLEGLEAKKHTIEVKYLGDDKYTDTSASKEYTVKPATQVELVFKDGNSVTKSYDPMFTYQNEVSGGSGTGAITYKLLDEGTGKATINETTGEITDIKQVGTIVIEATKASDGNYKERSIQYTLEIKKAEQKDFAIVDPGMKTYGDSAFILKTSGSVDSAVTYEVINGNAVTIDKETGEVTIAHAGEATIKATKSGNAFYEEVSTEITITIDKRELIITGDDKSKYIGQDDPSFTWSVSEGSIVVGDTIQGKLGYQGEGIGSYEIVEMEVFTHPDYRITYVPGTMTIKVTPSVEEVIEDINNLPEKITNDEEAKQVADITNKIDALTEIEKEILPKESIDKLEKAQEEAKQVNQDKEGIQVKGDLPWYVVLEVTAIDKSHPDYQRMQNQVQDKELLHLYNITLRNTLTNEVYEVDSEIEVTITASKVVGRKGIQVIHESKDGIETLSCKVKGDKVTFKTSSFSYYGIISKKKEAIKVNPTGDGTNIGAPVLGGLLSIGGLLYLRYKKEEEIG